ncbi:MAG: PqqD family protein, partial [Anaerolineae bacterium]|jgi:hypothetical protein
MMGIEPHGRIMGSTRDILASVYRLKPVVAIEDFGGSSLALHCGNLQLVELNATARNLIARLDGRSSLRQVAAAMAEQYDQPQKTIEVHAAETAARMLELDIIEQVASSPGNPNDAQTSTVG